MHGGEELMSDSAKGNGKDLRERDLRSRYADAFGDSQVRRTNTSAVDELSLASHRRAIAYGRARGNA